MLTALSRRALWAPLGDVAVNLRVRFRAAAARERFLGPHHD